MSRQAKQELAHESASLANGLRVVHTAMPGMRSVTVALFVSVGSRYETERTSGAAHLVEHMLFKGTERRRNATAISSTIDGVGGILNASTDKEITVVWAKVAREHLPLAVDLLADMTRHSRLTPAGFAREKQVVREELGMLRDDPQDWVHVLADELLWPGHPLGREVAGTERSVPGMRRKDLVDMMRKYYGPNNAVLSTSGGVDMKTIRTLADIHFGDWMPVEPQPYLPMGEIEGTARARLEFKDIEQTNLCLAFPGVARRHPDRYALELLVTILGGGTTSRLFTQLRERKGLAYDVHASSSSLSDTGAITIYAAADGKKIDAVLACMYAEIARLRTHRVPSEELARTKQYYRGRLSLGLEDTYSVATWFGGQALLENEVLTPDAVADSIDFVTQADLIRVAQKYLIPHASRIAVVGQLPDGTLESRLPAA